MAIKREEYIERKTILEVFLCFFLVVFETMDGGKGGGGRCLLLLLLLLRLLPRFERHGK